MLRLRVFRVLLPALLVLLGLAVAYSLKPRERAHREDVVVPAAPEAEGIAFSEFVEGLNTVMGKAERVLDSADGTLRLKGIENLRITRPGRGAVVINADSAAGVGPEAQRRWQFEDGVEFYDPDTGMRLTLPELRLDQQAGEARARGDILFEAPGMQGTVQAIVYSLTGGPSQLTDPVLNDGAGGRLVADSATLWDGFDDIELTGRVRAEQPDGWIEAERMRVLRDAAGRLRSVAGRGTVHGWWKLSSLLAGDVAADELDVEWDEAGRVARARLHGEASVRRGADRIAAPTIEALQSRATGGWDVSAHETVSVTGLFPGGTGLLRADRIEAELDAVGRLARATAAGRVDFEGPSLRAEGERGVYHAADPSGVIELYGDRRHKARLAREETRVAAASITTRLGGEDLLAEGSVEATLLPRADGGQDAIRGGLFRREDAVHFVADRLHSADGSSSFEFTGSVRGWQSENNLSAASVILEAQPSVLRAKGEVSTRFPRESGAQAIGEGDFVLVSADQLDYDESSALATYEGHVRMRLVEGTLAAERLEVQLRAGTRGIEEARAFGSVTLEMQRTVEGALEQPVSGRADRLRYVPSEATLRLYGDAAPAEVRRQDPGDVTTGRVLLYRLAEGTVEIDAGIHGPATISRPPTRSSEPK